MPDLDEYEDAATVAILRGLERSGHLQGVLAELAGDELGEVYAAEARFLDRQDARWADDSRAGRLPEVLPVGYPATLTRGSQRLAVVVLSHCPGVGVDGRDYLVRAADGAPSKWAGRAELGPLM